MIDKLDEPMTTRAPAAVLLVRIAVGWIFLSEGVVPPQNPSDGSAGGPERRRSAGVDPAGSWG